MKRLNKFVRRSGLALLAALVLTFAFSAATRAQVASATPYTIEQSVIASGGGTSSGGTNNVYKIEGTIGEPVAGVTSTSAPFTVKGGFFSANAFAPTAAGVTVGGRVINSAGKGIRNVVITMTDSSGAIRTTLSTVFGHFSFADVPAGESYIFNVTGKRFTFSQPVQVHSITEETDDIIFIGESIGLQVQ